ncbi:MAG: dihydrolipoamide acetyltransferase family protein [Anaerolineaceae bacterium]|nr:dihydrolipoamide acetyltransferase family protein [Anaerolineaceae bacterium]
MATKVIMPQLGESVVEGTVMRWLLAEGQEIEEFAALLEVNTDKVASEVPSPASGTLLKILVPEGATVKAGATLAWIGLPGEALIDDTQPLVLGVAVSAKPAQPEIPLQAAEVFAPTHPELGFISPVVARLAKEHQLDLGQVKGTGEGGRITKKDVLDYLDNPAKPEAPAALDKTIQNDLPPAAQTQPVPASTNPLSGDRLLPLSIQRKLIAGRMLDSLNTTAQLTTVMEADLSRIVAHRQANQAVFARDGADLTYTVYFVAAVTAALKAHPLLNSSWSEAGILLHKDIHIGLAVSLGEDGLIVPVIKSADQLSLLGIARAVNDLAEKARSRRLQPEQVQGGTFTITNHVVSGSLFATPIINPPQAAILGIGAIQKRPVVVDPDAIAIRPMVYLSLSFDHRILDGASADAFLSKVVERLENWGL